MANQIRSTAAVGMLALGLAIMTAPTTVAQTSRRALVLHVIDDAGVPQGQLGSAMEAVSSVYRHAGVVVTWTMDRDPAARTAPDMHVTVAILSREQSEHKCEADGLGPMVFGTAMHATHKATVFYARVVEYAALKGSHPVWMLGAVIAHEVGHLALGPDSHSTTGIMKPYWQGRIVSVPEFSAGQREILRRQFASQLRADADSAW
jgi:hypothetical protein